MAQVLVIDDAADLRLLLRMALQSDGHTVTDADGGDEAQRVLDVLDVLDLVILDVQMPSVDGWEVLARVRRHPVHASVPVLMCTVKFSHEDLLRAWELGCDGYLNKPFDLTELSRRVTTILDTDLETRARRRGEALSALHEAQRHNASRRSAGPGATPTSSPQSDPVATRLAP